MARIAFIPSDEANLKYAKMCLSSLRKFHSEEELPVKIVSNPTRDETFWYRATPIIAKDLLKEYDTVLKIDADSIITSPIAEAFEGEYDVAVVNNSNPRERESFPYQFLNIHPFAYVNNGLVVMKSKSFVEEWYDLCHSILFNGFQMREQDCLNLLVHGGHYKVRKLDEGDSFWGLASKGYWGEIKLQDGKLILPKGEDWPDKDKYIKVIHWAGGANAPDKMNFNIRFQPEVVTYLQELIK